MKICSKCKEEKILSEFGIDNTNKDKLTCACKKCRNEYLVKFFKENPEKQKEKNRQQRENRKNFYNSEKGILSSRKSHLKRMFGITLEEYHKLSEKQNHVCLICGKPEMNNKNKVLCVDHCHKNGKIRGLLCGLCNASLGGFLDNEQLLNNAIKYLKLYEFQT